MIVKSFQHMPSMGLSEAQYVASHDSLLMPDMARGGPSIIKVAQVYPQCHVAQAHNWLDKCHH